MEQQERGNQHTAPDPEPAAQEAPRADLSDSTWGQGAAAAMANLRRHHFGARQSAPPEDGPTAD
jgi:hypothetical protein